MVAGCLAGSIVIVAALLVFFVVRRRKRRRRRLLHEVMNQSWAARLAARHSVVGSVGSKDEEMAGTTFNRNARRPSRAPSISRSLSTISTSKKPSKSNHLPPHSSKTRYSPRHARTSLETDDLELSTPRTSISLCPSSPASATLPPPTVVVPHHDESDASMPGDEPGTTGALILPFASRPVSRGPNMARARETPSASQPGDWRSHARDGGTGLSDDLTSPQASTTTGYSPAASQGAVETTIGAHAYEIVGVDFGRSLPPTAEGETRRWKLGLGRHDESMDVGLEEHPSAAVRDRGTHHELEIVRVDDVPPAYEDV
ncbi:hypothetical protein NLJ89_g4341 [Agrocybe chaxingu]|uniref:Uncharacterized protein n=1 Tax=Agrocybe chaxingu TaxID=84603 RepID=A0A9W8MXS7_9AGAR|nr:hypothetical protein NLJ89_g4341 [Agrocybe chaxingu]